MVLVPSSCWISSTEPQLWEKPSGTMFPLSFPRHTLCWEGRFGSEASLTLGLNNLSRVGGWTEQRICQIKSVSRCSVQFSRWVVSDSSRPHKPQHTRPPCHITNSRSLPKLMSIELVMLANHLILCRPLLLPPSIFPSIRVFSNESALLYQVAKVLEFQLQHQSLQWIFRTDLL